MLTYISEFQNVASNEEYTDSTEQPITATALNTANLADKSGIDAALYTDLGHIASWTHLEAANTDLE